MASSNGWTILSKDDNGDVLDAVSSIHDLFEVVGQLERKCTVCSFVVKISSNSYWSMKRHFKNKHPDVFVPQNGPPPRKNNPKDSASPEPEAMDFGPSPVDLPDEFTSFGDLAVAGMRNMKTAEFRRKLKRAFQKTLLELMMAEDDMLEASSQ